MYTQTAIRPGASLYEGPRAAAGDFSPDTILSRLPVWLTAAAMATSTVSMWVYVQSLRNYVTPDIFDYSQVLKPPLYYVTHTLTILCVCGAGILALISARELLGKYGIRLLLLFFAGALMTFKGYTLAMATSTKIVASTGPFTVIVSLLLFVGAKPGNWRFLDKLFLWVAIVFSGLVGVALLSVQSASRWEAVLALGAFVNGLYFPATWLLLRPGSHRSALSWLRFIPFAVYAVASVFTQTRLNWVMIFAALAAYIYVEKKRRSPVGLKLLLAAGLGLWLVLFSSEYLTDTKAVQSLQASGQSFLDRLDEDTRSNQLVEFFANVQTSELVLGRGSLATWNWGGLDWGGGTDVGYLSLLFFGGLPLLLTYIALHVVPIFGVIKRPQSEWQRSCAMIGLLWALRMFSSSFPDMGIDYYPVLLCIGACLVPAQPPVGAGYARIGRGI